MTRVSVVIAAWNAAQTLERAVASAVAQEGVEVEVLVVDDCSTDGTAERIDTLARLHASVVPLRTPTNSGPSAARNLGLAAARGDWIAVLDSDDGFEPGRLAALVAHAEANRLDVVLDNLKIALVGDTDPPRALVSDKHAPLLAGLWTIPGYVELNRSYRSPVLTGFLKPLFRTGLLRANHLAYDPELRNSEDYLLILECLCRGARIGYLHRPLYLYWVSSASLSGQFNPTAHARFLLAETALLAREQARLQPGEAQAIRDHLEAARLAGETNALFGHLRGRRIGAALGLLLRRPADAPVHLGRVLKSAGNKVRSINTRGR